MSTLTSVVLFSIICFTQCPVCDMDENTQQISLFRAQYRGCIS